MDGDTTMVVIVITCLVVLTVAIALFFGWFYSPRGQRWWWGKRYGDGATEVFLDWFQKKRV
jgi:hypothetical protein